MTKHKLVAFLLFVVVALGQGEPSSFFGERESMAEGTVRKTAELGNFGYNDLRKHTKSENDSDCLCDCDNANAESKRAKKSMIVVNEVRPVRLRKFLRRQNEKGMTEKDEIKSANEPDKKRYYPLSLENNHNENRVDFWSNLIQRFNDGKYKQADDARDLRRSGTALYSMPLTDEKPRRQNRHRRRLKSSYGFKSRRSDESTALDCKSPTGRVLAAIHRHPCPQKDASEDRSTHS